MLSSNPIKNSSKASHYYLEQDNYYTREEGTEKSEWWGRGAQKLELAGKVDEKIFLELLQGKLPDGQQLGKKEDGKLKHRPGWDLTYSAPKSVSYLALVGGDKRLETAHRQAVLASLSQLELSCAQARVTTAKEMGYQASRNVVAALFRHDLSRAKDPQLHTHAVVMNMTERQDGKWRSLASKLGNYQENRAGEINGFFERVRHNNRYFAKIYEMELAYRVKELGYEITTETKSGKFEIVGVPQHVIDAFSKRREEIKKQLSEKGLSGGKAAAIATLATREEKMEVNRATLKEQWEQEASKLGYDCKPIIERSYQVSTGKQENEIPVNEHAFQAIQQATSSLSVFKTTFSLEELLIEATDYAIDHTVNVESLLASIESHLTNGNLVPLNTIAGKTEYLAKSTLEEENKLFALLADNALPQNRVKEADLDRYLNEHSEIHPNHHEHLKSIFGRDRIVLVEGQEAKATLLKPMMQIIKSSGLNVALLSPSLVGSKQFAKHAKQVGQLESLWALITSWFAGSTMKHYSTIQFLSQTEEMGANERPDLLIVDNAHLLSTHQKACLADWNRTNNSKLVLLGDKDTLLPQQRGTSFQHLIDHGVRTVTLRTNDESMVGEVGQGHIKEVIDKTLDRMVEVKDTRERLDAMAKHYVHLSHHERARSWLVGQSKKTVEELNLLVHDELLKMGHIKQPNQITALIPIFLVEGKSAFAASYKKDQIVRFNEAYVSLSINRGDYLRVIQSHPRSNCVVLQKSDGQDVMWHPHQVGGKTAGKVELFQEKQRSLAVGESIVFLRSLKSRRIVKGERFTIEAIGRQSIKMRGAEGGLVTLDLKKPYHLHFDYGYAATPYAIAHEKPSYLIAELPTKSFLTDQRQFYQAMSQPKEAWIYTDDIKGLAATLEKKTGDRLTAGATLEKAEQLKKDLHAFYGVLENKIAEHKGGLTQSSRIQAAIEAVEYAMHHLAERNAGFTHKELMETAMHYAFGKVTTDVLTKTIIEMEKASILLRGQRADGTLWTTTEAVKIEREILALSIKDKGTLLPIASDEVLTRQVNLAALRPEQIAAVKAITQSTDRVISVQGWAGVGKTTMMISVSDCVSAKSLLTAEGYALRGIGPTHKAVKELSARGISAQTIDNFILEMERISENRMPHDFSKTLLVVDEASMVSNRRMRDVLTIAHQLHFREVIITGDTEQNPSIEAGKPHDLIQLKLDDKTIYLKDIQRQKNEILKQAVYAIYAGDVTKTFSLLDKAIVEIRDEVDANHCIVQSNYPKRIQTLVADYISLLVKGENAQIIAPSHEDRKAVNEQVRLDLSKMNILKGQDHTFPILSVQNLTAVERSNPANFKKGQILRFSLSAGKGIKAGDYFLIQKINPEHNILFLSNMNGADGEIIWQIPRTKTRVNKVVEVLQQENRELKVGDKIIWTRTNRKEGTISSDFADVTDINQDRITVKRPDNTVFSFNGNDKRYQHWDHGYAITAHSAQGGTYSTVFAILESHRKKLMNHKNFLAILTRAVNNLYLYTDNKEKLQGAILANRGDKLSSLEVIGEYPEKQTSQIITQKEAPKDKENKEHKKGLQDPHFTKLDIERIKEGLNRNVEKIAVEMLGEPKLRGNNFLKFGSRQGSLSVTTKGQKQGWFNDFEMNQGGHDMLKFIQVYSQMSKKEALRYGARWLGLPIEADQTITKKIIDKPKATEGKSQAQLSDYEKRRMKLANKIARECQPIKGTLADKYLKEYRGLNLEKMSDDIRFHPGIYSKINKTNLPALIAIARDEAGKIQSVEAIYLDPKTGNKADVPLPKQTIGPKKGVAVTINHTHNPQAPTLLVEGVVTGLSLAKSLPDVNVKVTLGKQMLVSVAPGLLTEKVILCLDNDGKNLQTDKTILAVANRLAEHKKNVSFMIPEGLNMKKQDYNDILVHAGEGRIQHDFHHAIPYADFYKVTPTQQVSLDQINAVTKIMTSSLQQQDKAYLAAYEQVVKEKNQVLTEKHQSRIKEIETDI